MIHEKLNTLSILLKGYPLRGTVDYEPLFIVSAGRSGTSLLRAILNVHPDLHVLPETHALGDVIRLYKRVSRFYPWEWDAVVRLVLSSFDYYPNSDLDLHWQNLYMDLKNLPEADRNLSNIIHRLFMSHARQHKPTATFWGEKSPLNALHLKEIWSVFPKGHYIHLLRDGRDVVLSFNKMGRFNTIDEAINRWISAVEACQAFGSKHPEQFLEVRYEELVVKPERQIKEICNFLGIKYMDSMIHHDKYDSTKDIEKYDHMRNVMNPISTRSIGKWKDADRKEIEIIEKKAGSLLKLIGY